MEEAERLCDRVGIIDEGRLVAEGTRRELTAKVGQRDRLRLGASGDLERLAEACRGEPGILEATAGEGAVELLADDGRRRLVAVVDAADRAGVEIDTIEIVEPDLEAVFLHLTGKALRD
jgi:ABC-2 type transport system ATP-binding protein